jgi:hypothetical protein
MSAIDRLLVIWGEPVKGGRHIIGHLERAGGEVRFWYERDLTKATACGFRLLPEFSQQRAEDDPYRARYLFALFAERIPALSRADAAEMLRAWGVERPDDQFEVLAKSGGIRATDRLELAEYRAPDDELVQPLEFRVAGRRHILDAAPLAVGAKVSLCPEPDNEADAGAVIVDRDGRRAGYVPRQYTELVGRLLERSVAIDGQVTRQLLVPDDVGKWVVRIARRG